MINLIWNIKNILRVLFSDLKQNLYQKSSDLVPKDGNSRQRNQFHIQPYTFVTSCGICT